MKKILLVLIISISANVFSFDEYLGWKGRLLPNGELFEEAHKKTSDFLVEGVPTVLQNISMPKILVNFSNDATLMRYLMLVTSRIIIFAGQSIRTEEEFNGFAKDNTAFFNLFISFNEEEIFYLKTGLHEFNKQQARILAKL